MKLRELDDWYKANEIVLDDFMRVSGRVWGALSHEKKVAIFDEYGLQSKKEDASNFTAARQYHNQPEVIDYFVRNRLSTDDHNYSTEQRQRRIVERQLDVQLSASEKQRLTNMGMLNNETITTRTA